MDQAGSTSPTNDDHENNGISEEQTQPVPPQDAQVPPTDVDRGADSLQDVAAQPARHPDAAPVWEPAPVVPVVPVVPIVPPARVPSLERERMRAEARHLSRRRRRYTFFVRRSARKARAIRQSNAARALWATAIILLVLLVGSLSGTVSAATAYYNSEYVLIQGMQRQVANKDSVRIYDDTGALLYQINTDGSQHSISLANVP